jgi:uncharacterized protein YbcV (DUF1398 family)
MPSVFDDQENVADDRCCNRYRDTSAHAGIEAKLYLQHKSRRTLKYTRPDIRNMKEVTNRAIIINQAATQHDGTSAFRTFRTSVVVMQKKWIGRRQASS